MEAYEDVVGMSPSAKSGGVNEMGLMGVTMVVGVHGGTDAVDDDDGGDRNISS